MGKTHKHGLVCEVCGDTSTHTATLDCAGCEPCVCEEHTVEARKDAGEARNAA